MFVGFQHKIWLRGKNSIGGEYLLSLGKANSNFKTGIMFCS